MATYKPTGWAAPLTGLQPNSGIVDAQYLKGKVFRAIILSNRIRGKEKAKRQAGSISRNGLSANSIFDRNKEMIYHADNIDMSGMVNRGPEIIEYPTEDIVLKFEDAKSTTDIPPYKPAVSSNAAGLKSVKKVGKKKVFTEAIKTRGYEEAQKEKITLLFYGGGFEDRYKKLELQFVPREVQITPENRVVAIAQPGRNTPVYHYTGSEDTLEFTIDWVSMDESNDKTDVIEKCMWLEAMSKNDAFDNKPAIVEIVWGNAERGRLFDKIAWVIAKAPYKLQNFNRGYNDPYGSGFISTSLLPIQAYQEITLKRLDDHNTSRRELFYQKHI